MSTLRVDSCECALALGTHPLSPLPAVAAAAGNGNVQIWGTQPDAIDEAEDRDRWMELLKRLDIRQPAGGVATNEQEALAIANNVGTGVQAAWWRCRVAEQLGQVGSPEMHTPR